MPSRPGDRRTRCLPNDPAEARAVCACATPPARTPENAQLLALLAQLAVLAESVARMRTEQDRAVQAASAKQAAEQIHVEHHRRLAGTTAGPGKATRAAPVTEVGRRPGPAAPGQQPGRSR